MEIKMKNGKILKTKSVRDFTFRSTQQAEKAARENIVEAFDFRYTFELPQYIEREFEAMGFTPVLLGYTTYQSSTWGLKRENGKKEGCYPEMKVDFNIKGIECH